MKSFGGGSWPWRRRGVEASERGSSTYLLSLVVIVLILIVNLMKGMGCGGRRVGQPGAAGRDT